MSHKDKRNPDVQKLQLRCIDYTLQKCILLFQSETLCKNSTKIFGNFFIYYKELEKKFIEHS